MIKQQFKLPLFIAVIFLSGIYFFIFSSSGLLERVSLKKKNEILAHDIENLKGEKKGLQSLLKKYRNGEEMPDDLQNSGYIKKGDRLILLQNPDGTEISDRSPAGDEKYPAVRVKHYRIIWVVISALTIFLILFFGRKNKTSEL